MADVVKVTLKDRVHPLYEEYVSRWELYYDAVKGGESFITTDNLSSHRLEDSTDYDERFERSYYLNFTETLPKLYNSLIYKEHIERPGNEDLAIFRTNTDGRGKNMNDFVKRAGFLASTFGAVHCIVDIPSAPKKSISKFEEKSLGLYPYATLFTPIQVKDWSMDKFGRLRWIVIEEKYYNDIDPTVKRIEEVHYKLITTTEWRVEDDKGQPVTYDDDSPSSGKNPLGMVPIATMYNNDIDDNMVGESMLKDIVYINRAIFNWCSCIDEQIERQTFSQLVVPDDGTLAEEKETSGDPLYKIGTSSIYTFPHDSGHPPAFISPDVQNITAVWKLVIDHVKEIFRLSGLMGSSDDMYIGKSGRAAQFGFISVNSCLASKAASYQKFENDISKLAMIHLGKKPEDFKEVKYAESFDVGSLTEEIDNIFKVMESNISDTLNIYLKKTISMKIAPLAPDDLKEKIESEIEAQGGKFESPETIRNREKIENTSKDGNDGPKNTSVKDTFMTKDKADSVKSSHRIPEDK